MAQHRAKYFQLEPAAFLTDQDCLLMTGEQRGVYVWLIFLLYANGGKLKLDPEKLAKLCNVKPDFDFQTVFCKFKVRRGFIYHKRVSAEMQKSQDRVDKAVTAANARWDKQCPGNALASTEQCQAKGSEAKRSEGKGSNNTNTNTEQLSCSASPSIRAGQLQAKVLRFEVALRKILKERTQSDRTCFKNVTTWLCEEIAADKFTEEIFDRVLDYAKQSTDGRQPAAVFMALLKKELGYTGKAKRNQ